MTKLPTALRALLAAAALCALPPPAAAVDFGAPSQKPADIRPQDVINWQAFQATEAADYTVEAALRLITTSPDWKIYAKNLKFSGPTGFTVSKIAPPPAQRFMDPISNEEVDVYPGGEFSITFSGAPRWTAATFPVTVTYVGCTNVICLFPYSQVVEVAFTPAAAATPAAIASSSTPNASATAATATEGDDLEARLAKRLGAADASFGLLLAIVFVGGLLSNLTPCVAPMVPITLRLLSRQGGNPYGNAAIYAFGIVLCYSALGLAAALSGGLFGSLLASKAFNVAFAVMMILLGMTMIGFGDLSKLQVLGSRIGSGKPSPTNTFLMGIGAGLVAAPCTGPILAALLAYTARNASSVAASTALLGIYSAGFALPYVLLGGAASQMTKLRVPPLVQLSVKLLFGAVMFGLGFYYLRIPLYDLAVALKPHWRLIALSGLTCGAAISPLVLLSQSLQNNKVATLVPALLLGLGLFAAWQWATSAGEGEAAGEHLTWYHTEDEAFAAAQRSGHPILIDMWAEWCEACKKMDVTTMADAEVRAELTANWVLLRLDLTESNPANDAIQQRYAVQSLPNLVLLPKSAQIDQKDAINGYVSAAALLSGLRQYAHK